METEPIDRTAKRDAHNKLLEGSGTLDKFYESFEARRFETPCFPLRHLLRALRESEFADNAADWLEPIVSHLDNLPHKNERNSPVCIVPSNLDANPWIGRFDFFADKLLEYKPTTPRR